MITQNYHAKFKIAANMIEFWMLINTCGHSNPTGTEFPLSDVVDAFPRYYYTSDVAWCGDDFHYEYINYPMKC
ncbi:hypothetical protein ACTXT7_000537 [Hymenolepis weldensis]